MRAFTSTFLLATAAMMAAASAEAQEALLVELEGRISDITLNATTGDATLTVMGTTVNVPAMGAAITSPTAELSVDQLADATPFPGRTQGGFLGGTAIVLGMSGVDNGDVVTATEVFVEPAENVIFGIVSQNDVENGLVVEGTRVALLPNDSSDPGYDARFPGEPVMNDYGFEIIPETIPADTWTSVEGYFGETDGIFHAFLIQAEGGQMVNAGSPEVSVLRAQCRQRSSTRIELAVLGATHDPATGSVAIKNAATGTDYGTATVVQDAEAPEFGLYNYDRRLDRVGPCPEAVQVTFGTAVAVAEVDVRID